MYIYFKYEIKYNTIIIRFYLLDLVQRKKKRILFIQQLQVIFNDNPEMKLNIFENVLRNI